MPPKSGSILLILLILVILGLFYLSVRSQTPPSYEEMTRGPEKPAETGAKPVPTITLADPSLGPAKAAVTIIEYSDFRCPHCALAEMELKKILQTYPDKVRLVWKDFPFLPPLNITWLTHAAARCAERQNKFWEYHDLIFANQQDLSQDKLLSFARELKLNETDFSQCLASGQTKPLVSRGFEEGKAVGVDGTPFFFVNGEKWNGEMTVENIAEVVAIPTSSREKQSH